MINSFIKDYNNKINKSNKNYNKFKIKFVKI